MIRPSGFGLLPPVVKNLLIINGLFFLATIVFSDRFGINLIDILGLRFPFADDFRPYQIITYLFMHANFGHIFFNMFAVWMFGSVLENYWGPKRFLIYYLLTGVGAAVVHYLVHYIEMMPTLEQLRVFLENPSHSSLLQFLNSEHFQIRSQTMVENFDTFRRKYNDLMSQQDNDAALSLAQRYILQYREDFLNAPNVVGASGALFGILLAFGMIFPNSVLYLFFAIPIKAKYFVILYGLAELIMGITSTGSNIAHFAHLGGMLFGFILIKIWGTGRRDYY
jgi:membrane associated rhomboid family serine protease